MNISGTRGTHTLTLSIKIISPYIVNTKVMQYVKSFRSSACFSLGWPMHNDGDFFASIHESRSSSLVRS